MHTRQSVAGPAQHQNTADAPTVFEWYENQINEGLEKVYRNDISERQRIVAVMREMADSHMFWKLMTKYTTACEENKDGSGEHDALMALLARIYIAGSLREVAVIEA